MLVRQDHVPCGSCPQTLHGTRAGRVLLTGRGYGDKHHQPADTQPGSGNGGVTGHVDEAGQATEAEKELAERGSLASFHICFILNGLGHLKAET